jgi:hypothetical protein
MHATIAGKDGVLLEVKRSFWSGFRFYYNLKVYDGDGTFLGTIDEDSKVNPELRFYDHRDKLIMRANCREFAHYKYTFIRLGKTIARMDKQWKGRILKEMFTTADKYRVEFSPALSDNEVYKKFILATCISIDLIFKEKGNSGFALEAFG